MWPVLGMSTVSKTVAVEIGRNAVRITAFENERPDVRLKLEQNFSRLEMLEAKVDTKARFDRFMEEFDEKMKRLKERIDSGLEAILASSEELEAKKNWKLEERRMFQRKFDMDTRAREFERVKLEARGVEVPNLGTVSAACDSPEELQAKMNRGREEWSRVETRNDMNLQTKEYLGVKLAATGLEEPNVGTNEEASVERKFVLSEGPVDIQGEGEEKEKRGVPLTARNRGGEMLCVDKEKGDIMVTQYSMNSKEEIKESSMGVRRNIERNEDERNMTAKEYENERVSIRGGKGPNFGKKRIVKNEAQRRSEQKDGDDEYESDNEELSGSDEEDRKVYRKLKRRKEEETIRTAFEDKKEEVFNGFYEGLELYNRKNGVDDLWTGVLVEAVKNVNRQVYDGGGFLEVRGIKFVPGFNRVQPVGGWSRCEGRETQGPDRVIGSRSGEVNCVQPIGGWSKYKGRRQRQWR